MIWASAYVGSVVLVNVIFGRLPPPWSVIIGSAIVGGIFIVRDLAQREIGHRVLFATFLGIGISYVMADPFVAGASAFAFFVSEIADWIVFSVARKSSFRARVVLSHCASVPLDSIVFLLGIGALGWAPLAMQIASKTAALVVVLWMSRNP